MHGNSLICHQTLFNSSNRVSPLRRPSRSAMGKPCGGSTRLGIFTTLQIHSHRGVLGLQSDGGLASPGESKCFNSISRHKLGVYSYLRGCWHVHCPARRKNRWDYPVCESMNVASTRVPVIFRRSAIRRRRNFGLTFPSTRWSR